VFQASLHGCVLGPQPRHRLQRIAKTFQPRPHLPRHFCRQIECHPARPYEAAPKATAREHHQEIQAFAAHRAEKGRGGLIGHVPRDRSQIANVIGETLQLEGDTADTLRARRLARAAERFDRATVGTAVADRRIARDRLGDDRRAYRAGGFQQSLDAAMLPPQHDFEKQHVLAMCLNTKMPGLNHSRVHGANRHLVNFLSLDMEECIFRGIEHDVRPTTRPMIGQMPAQRLEPGMAHRQHRALLGDFPLEDMRLRTVRRERGILLAHEGGRRIELAVRIVRQDGDEACHLVTLAQAEERDDATSAGNRVGHRFAEPINGFQGNGAERHGATIAQLRGDGGGHGASPPSAVAALASACCSGAGMYTPSMRTAVASATGPASSHQLSRARVAGGVGSPSAISRISSAMPTKITARKTSMAAAIQGCPAPTAARRMVNSLWNNPNGGDPVMANSPRTSSAPDTGSVRMRPRFAAAAELPVASTTLPATRKSQAFASPLFRTCSTVP